MTALDLSRVLQPRKPVSYATTLDAHRRGVFTLGFIWDLARYDEVFAAFLRRNNVPRLNKAEDPTP